MCFTTHQNNPHRLYNYPIFVPTCYLLLLLSERLQYRHLPARQSSDSRATFQFFYLLLFICPQALFSLCITSRGVVSSGFVIKSTLLVRHVIRSESTAWAALSASVMSSVRGKCQRMRFMEDVPHQEKHTESRESALNPKCHH